ncbi:MAG: hypothetical protein ACYC26_07840 [Phycisphaerales bacterium]
MLWKHTVPCKHWIRTIFVPIAMMASLSIGIAASLADSTAKVAPNIDKSIIAAINTIIENQRKIFDGATIEPQASQSSRDALFELWLKMRQADSDTRESVARYLVEMRVAGKDRAEKLVGDFLPWIFVTNPESQVFVLIPLLSSENAEMRSYVINGLEFIDHHESQFDCNYSYYKSYISKHRNQPLNDLVRYMYQYNSAKAFQTMLQVYAQDDDRKLLLSLERDVSDVAWRQSQDIAVDEQMTARAHNALLTLANRPEWWVHLYVAFVMQQHPVLRQTEVIQKLQKDEHPLVREAAASLATPQPQP